MKDHQINKHIPVLANEVIQYLDPQQGESYLDITAGYGGHAQLILERTLNYKNSVLVDRDDQAIETLQHLFGSTGTSILHRDYLDASWDLIRAGKRFDIILADLGISSVQIDRPERGFSFQNEGPLDMRMDRRQKITAADLVNTYSEDQLVKIVRDYGEEPKARRIARAIVASRPFHTTLALSEAIAAVYGKRHKVNPATKTFQALRIAVNQEIEMLSQALPLWLELLAPGGRLAIISFHSLEDRIVKQALSAQSGNRYDASLKLLTKKPVMGTQNEIVLNPRARSAKLRAAVKIKK